MSRWAARWRDALRVDSFGTSVYQLRVVVRAVSPLIRIDMSIADLHMTLQRLLAGATSV